MILPKSLHFNKSNTSNGQVAYDLVLSDYEDMISLLDRLGFSDIEKLAITSKLHILIDNAINYGNTCSFP